MRGGLSAAYRRTGADLPWTDPRPTHGAEMEGWFWRITDPSGLVVVALCGVNRQAEGDWATVGLVVHPDGLVFSDAVSPALAARDRYVVEAGRTLLANDRRLHVEIGAGTLDVEFDDVFGWPLRLGAGGVFSALPWLGQYWHPHILGARASGTLTVDGAVRRFENANVYAEKNWGAGFPEWWWWGQAQGFSDPSLCVAFGGGRLRAGPLGADVTGCVVRLDDRVVRFAPPFALVRTKVEGRRWVVTARKPGWRLTFVGDGRDTAPSVLPVPLPAERRNVDQDFEYLAAHAELVVEHKGERIVQATTELAGLEVGALDPARAEGLRRSVV